MKERKEKKEEDKKSEHLNITVKGQDGSEVYFKVQKSKPFQSVMDAYCRKIGADIGATRFLFDGKQIKGTQTPEDLGMEDEDEITAMVLFCFECDALVLLLRRPPQLGSSHCSWFLESTNFLRHVTFAFC